MNKLNKIQNLILNKFSSDSSSDKKTELSFSTSNSNMNGGNDFSEIKDNRKKLTKIYSILSQLNSEINLNRSSSSILQHKQQDEYLRTLLTEYLNKIDSITDSDLQKLENEFINMTPQQYRLVKLDNSALIKNKEKYVYDLMREKIVGYDWIKQMEKEGHRKLNEMKRTPVQNRNKQTFFTNDQRFFQKIYTTMNLGSLRAVDKAYEDQDVDQRRSEKKKKVNILRSIKVIKLN